jgi:hypothetical protein
MVDEPEFGMPLAIIIDSRHVLTSFSFSTVANNTGQFKQ